MATGQPLSLDNYYKSAKCYWEQCQESQSVSWCQQTHIIKVSSYYWGLTYVGQQAWWYLLSCAVIVLCLPSLVCDALSSDHSQPLVPANSCVLTPLLCRAQHWASDPIPSLSLVTGRRCWAVIGQTSPVTALPPRPGQKIREGGTVILQRDIGYFVEI